MDDTSRPRDHLVDAICEIVASDGLDAVTVRQVAAHAGVSIGAVQHHFRTKDAMLLAAFRHVVDATEKRVSAVALGPNVRRNLSVILRELLPLDARRLREAKVYVAFAARAATSEPLAEVQRATLAHSTEQLAEAFLAASQEHGQVSAAEARRSAELLLAVTDGLTFDAVTRGRRPDPRRLSALLDAYLDGVLGD